MRESVLAAAILLAAATTACDSADHDEANRPPGTAPPALASPTVAPASGTRVPLTSTAPTKPHPTTAPATGAASDAADGPNSAERLLGTWVANDVDTSLGDVKVKLTFREEGGMKLAAWSDLPLVGQVREKRGSYTVDGNTISSQAIRGGTTVKYRFDAGQLLIEYEDGKTVRFQRAS